MLRFKADLHIHTCLSPCGDLEMSPRNILRVAGEKGLNMIAITDHNTTRNVKVCVELGKKAGIFVIPGCEVNTQEEVHCLSYFPDLETLEEFQRYLDEKMPVVKNDPYAFGFQVAVDENDVIVYEEERSLYMGLEDNIETVAKKVHALGGIFVPAHIDRPRNSVFSQLGFMPFDLGYDALEISWRTTPEDFLQAHAELTGKPVLRNSDAHYPEDIGKAYNWLEMEEANWENFKAIFSIPNPKSQIRNRYD